VFEALGTIDELAAFIGQARCECSLQGCGGVAAYLEAALSTLLDVGASVATPLKSARPVSEAKRERTSFSSQGLASVLELEMRIDRLAAELPPLTTFILVSGGRAATALHVARTVCRRAERRCVGVPGGVDPNVVVFLNRLSDYLFMAARWVAADASTKEVTYKPGSRSRPRPPVESTGSTSGVDPATAAPFSSRAVYTAGMAVAAAAGATALFVVLISRRRANPG
jgi:ATP:cob(I)alamin adenosyltransferase